MQQVPEDVRLAAAQAFAVDSASLHWIGGTDGSVYSVRKGSLAYILKIAPVTTDDLARQDEILAFKRYLAENDVPVALPVESAQGRALETITSGEQGYLATLTLRARGLAPSARNAYLWNDALFQAWGKVMGRMHALAKRYPYWRSEQANTVLGDFRSEHQWFADWSEDAEVTAYWWDLYPLLEALPVERESYGLIHNDLHNNNFLYDPQPRGGWPLTLLDFDVSAYFWFINDIAVALYHAVQNWGRTTAQRRANARVFQDAFLRGYNQENTLEDRWWQHLPLFLRYRDFVLFTAMSHEYPAGSRQRWQSRWLGEMRQRIITGEVMI